MTQQSKKSREINYFTWFIRVFLYVLIFTTTTVLAFNAAERYRGDYERNHPVTWKQDETPFSDEPYDYCSDRTYGPCGCGTFSATSLMLKTGYVAKGTQANEILPILEEHEVIHRCVINDPSSGMCEITGQTVDEITASGYGFAPAYEWKNMTQATDGYIRHIQKHSNEGYAPYDINEAKNILRDAYSKGYFAVLTVNLAGPTEGHAIIFDYVDEDDNIVVVDSGGRFKYLDGLYNTLAIDLFEVEGLSIQDAPKLWLKEDLFEEGAIDGADNSIEGDGNGYSNNNNQTGQMTADGLIKGEYEDPFAWSDKPIVEYQEHVDKKADDQIKGVQRKNEPWWQRLLGQ